MRSRKLLGLAVCLTAIVALGCCLPNIPSAYPVHLNQQSASTDYGLLVDHGQRSLAYHVDHQPPAIYVKDSEGRPGAILLCTASECRTDDPRYFVTDSCMIPSIQEFTENLRKTKSRLDKPLVFQVTTVNYQEAATTSVSPSNRPVDWQEERALFPPLLSASRRDERRHVR